MIQIICKDNQLYDRFGNVTFATNTAQIVNGGVFGNQCLYFDNIPTKYASSTQNIIPGNLINNNWTISIWFKCLIDCDTWGISNAIPNFRIFKLVNQNNSFICGFGLYFQHHTTDLNYAKQGYVFYTPNSKSIAKKYPYARFFSNKQWVHIVITKNINTFNMYMNNELVGSYTHETLNTSSNTSYTLFLGDDNSNQALKTTYIDRLTIIDEIDSTLDSVPPPEIILKPQYLRAMNKYKTREDIYNDSLFVKKVSGKDLSTNDYTSAEATKLSGIESGAQVNILESISVNNTLITPTDKNINIDMTNYGTLADISSAFKYKGSVASFSLLPLANQEVGDVYNIEAADATNGINAGDNVAWNGTGWDVLAGTVDLSGYVQAEEGKGLSHIDVTQAMKDAWDAAADGADVTQAEINALFGLTTTYVAATGTYVAGTTYYTDNTGTTTVDTTGFTPGVTDVSSYFVENTVPTT